MMSIEGDNCRIRCIQGMVGERLIISLDVASEELSIHPCELGGPALPVPQGTKKDE
jgi:hypothetical protein